MEIIRFTKFWAPLSIEQLGARAAALGYDGLDLVVREGYAINPANLTDALPRALAHWRALGLSCPLITAETSLTDPHLPQARALFTAAGHAGVEMVKLGYFEYTPGSDLEIAWDNAKSALAGFANLAERTGVKAVYHTHSGVCLGSNCAGLRHLLENLDPRYVGAYVDLGHLAVNGEDVQLGLPLVRAHLAAISAKDAHHILDSRPTRLRRGLCRFGPPSCGVHRRIRTVVRRTPTHSYRWAGAAEIGSAIELLKRWRFEGPISVHTEYTTDPSVVATVGGRDDSAETVSQRERGEVTDLAFLRSLGV